MSDLSQASGGQSAHVTVQGVDFHFSNRAHGQKFVDFLQSVIPIRFRQDKQLVSHNTHTSTYNYKYTYSVEIVPICRVRMSSFMQGWS